MIKIRGLLSPNDADRCPPHKHASPSLTKVVRLSSPWVRNMFKLCLLKGIVEPATKFEPEEIGQAQYAIQKKRKSPAKLARLNKTKPSKSPQKKKRYKTKTIQKPPKKSKNNTKNPTQIWRTDAGADVLRCSKSLGKMPSAFGGWRPAECSSRFDGWRGGRWGLLLEKHRKLMKSAFYNRL